MDVRAEQAACLAKVIQCKQSLTPQLTHTCATVRLQVFLQGIKDSPEPADKNDGGGIWAAQAEGRLHPAAPRHRGHRPLRTVSEGASTSLLWCPTRWPGAAVHLRTSLGSSAAIVHVAAAALCNAQGQRHTSTGSRSIVPCMLLCKPLSPDPAQNVKPEKLFSRERAVQQLLGLIDRTTLADNGAYWVSPLSRSVPVCCPGVAHAAERWLCQNEAAERMLCVCFMQAWDGETIPW
jgi:hypothetical protein